MDHYQKKEQDYAKWDASIWLSVEKEISAFQNKVMSCMLGLGELKKSKLEDFNVQPCVEEDCVIGEDLYVSLIRPICANKGYIPKQVPTEEDLEGSDSDDSNSDSNSDNESEKKKPVVKKEAKKEEVKVEKKKGGGKKGSKNNQKNDEKINQVFENIKQKLLSDFEIVLGSHSLERMQIDYSLKEKRLELKLTTFFYIAYYIRKNKEKQKIDEIEVFELINILVKIVRIFDGLKGRSFYSDKKKKNNEDELIEVSPTALLDLKLCIKGLKDYYKYTNKKVIINYPKLVYYTRYDVYFPTLDIKPYPSQIEFIQAVKNAFNVEKGTLSNPVLILYKTMIGSGKTSASMSLSNLISETKLLDAKNENLQVLYSCLIGSVRVQVGRYAYNKNQKFALAAMERSIKDEGYFYPRVINSYKNKYEKVVDLIISDLDCTFSMLDKHHYSEREEQIIKGESEGNRKVKVGVLEKENIVLFIDEPTAFCKDINSPATRKLFKILANHPPKLIILASATMPSKEELSNTIKLVEERNPGLKVFQVESKEFQIGCQYSSFKGEIIFPHTGVKNQDQLKVIVDQIDKNPFLMRLYTGPSLYFLLKKCESIGLKNLPKIDDLPEIKQNDISKATMKILNNLIKCTDEQIEEVCRLSADEANLDFKINEKDEDSDDDIFGDADEEEKVSEKVAKTDYVNFKGMLRQDAFKFLGGCLIATDEPLVFAKKHFEKWFKLGKKEYIKPVKRLIEKYQRDVQALEREIKLLEDDDKRDDIITKEISKLQAEKQPKVEFPDHKRINTIDHYNKYCQAKEPVHLSMLIKPVPIEIIGEQLIEEVDDFVLKLLFCGVALYQEKGLSSKYLDKVEELASQNYLAYIITDRSLCYGTNFPISNVILCDDLATKLNMNEMFQLIGRAGRVGQSWTARAFLEEKGLEKLSQYIHNQNQKMSEEAEIFEQIAQEHLDNPELSLRTTKSEIKYIDLENPDQRIEIIVKKKNKEDYHIFRKVSLVPFITSNKILAKKMPYGNINHYHLAQSDIYYEDLPTKLNSQNEKIIDVQAYYKNEQEFIRNTLDNAARRILETVFDGKVKGDQLNQFKPKVYEDFFNMQSNTFSILFRCKEESEVNGFLFQRLESNAVEKQDEMLKEKIEKFIRESQRVSKIVRENPTSVLANDVKFIRETHDDLIERPKTDFYKHIWKAHEPEATLEFDELVKNIQDKSSLENISESTVALFVDKYFDFKEIDDKLFHIDPTVRKIWPKIEAALEK